MKSVVMGLFVVGCLHGASPPRDVEKPTFELLSFEQYKAAYPDIRGMECGLEDQFDTFMHVYGVTFAAMPNTPVPEIIHAGKVWAQLIDSDEDFVPDDPKIYQWHQRDQHDGKRVIVILVDNKSFDNKFSYDRRAERVWMNQALRPGHSGVGHSRDGEMDTAVEELFHRICGAYGQVYPDAFGIPEGDEPGRSTKLSRALDKARGMGRQTKPVDGRWVYPREAWYTYNDGVTHRGKPGRRGAYTRITVLSDAPDTLHYYCSRHPGSAVDGVIKIVGTGD